jgi:hypothetical protein
MANSGAWGVLAGRKSPQLARPNVRHRPALSSSTLIEFPLTGWPPHVLAKHPDLPPKDEELARRSSWPCPTPRGSHACGISWRFRSGQDRRRLSLHARTAAWETLAVSRE